MKHKTKGFIAMILALCLMMSLGIGALAQGPDLDEGEESGKPTEQDDTEDPDVEPGKTTPETKTKYTLTSSFNPTACSSVTFYSEASCGTEITSAAAGTTVYVKISPYDGYRISNVQYKQNDASGSYSNTKQEGNNVYSFTMPAGDSYVAVEFVRVYDITCQPADNGSVTSSVYEAAEGDSVTITASPSDLYTLDTLTVDGQTVIAKEQTDGTFDYTFEMPAKAVVVSATFKLKETQPDTYNVSRSATSANITLTSGEKAYEAGKTVTFTVAAHQGYRLSSVYVSGASGNVTYSNNNGVYSFEMPEEDVTIYAIATAITPPAD